MCHAVISTQSVPALQERETYGTQGIHVGVFYVTSQDTGDLECRNVVLTQENQLLEERVRRTEAVRLHNLFEIPWYSRNIYPSNSSSAVNFVKDVQSYLLSCERFF